MHPCCSNSKETHRLSPVVHRVKSVKKCISEHRNDNCLSKTAFSACTLQRVNSVQDIMLAVRVTNCIKLRQDQQNRLQHGRTDLLGKIYIIIYWPAQLKLVTGQEDITVCPVCLLIPGRLLTTETEDGSRMPRSAMCRCLRSSSSTRYKHRVLGCCRQDSKNK